MDPVLVLTRPVDGADRFERALAFRGQTLRAPALQIVPLQVEADVSADAFIFTSGHGVRCAAALGLSVERAFCVGSRTADLARAAGFSPQFSAENADALVARLIAQKPQGRLLHLRGARARGQIAQRLQQAGLIADEVIVYRQERLSPTAALVDAVAGPAPLVFPLFSPATAAIVAELAFKTPTHVIAMSAAVGEALGNWAPTTQIIAARPDQAAMVDATRAVLSRLTVT